MSMYFSSEMAIAERTQNTGTVLRTVANRYISQNPSYEASFYAYQKNGIRQDKNYRYVFQFHEVFPQANLESNIYAWSKLWSDQNTAMSFEITCFGPVIVYCNGERVYKPNVFFERRSDVSSTFTVDMKKGWNSFVLQFIRTNTGCGGTLSAISSRNRPLSFIVPSSERKGQKGWLYTGPLQNPFGQLPEPGISEASTGISWYPQKDWLPEELSFGQMKRMYSLRKNCYALAWCRLYARKPEMYTFKGRHEGSIYVFVDQNIVHQSDGSGEYCFELAIGYGNHHILVQNHCGTTDWGFTLDCLCTSAVIPISSPVEVRGSMEVWFYAGPFPKSHNFRLDKVYRMDKPIDAGDAKHYWRLDKPETAIRPYNDNRLFGHWNYPLGVTLYGLIETGRFLKEPKFKQYVAEHVRFCTQYFEYALWDMMQYGAASMHNLLTTISTLDDCGSFGSLMVEASCELEDKGYIVIAEYIADFISNKLERMQDGALCRINPAHPLMDGTIWADDLYMSIPFLCRYYRVTGKLPFIEDAARQLILYHEYLYRPDLKIMSHVYDIKHGKPTEVSWGRGNGWVAFSYSEILAFLPEGHLYRNELLHNFNSLCEGYIILQDQEGLWHQVLTDFESYAEASCTSMFACAFARGVRNGWLTEPEKYIHSVGKAWEGLCKHVIDMDGNVYGICKGSGFSFSADYYKNDLGWIINDTHGTGIVLLAGVEYGKLMEWLESNSLKQQNETQ